MEEERRYGGTKWPLVTEAHRAFPFLLPPLPTPILD